MKVAFRVDVSAQIGTGHLMRCLTLADALKQRGTHIRIISRHMLEPFQGLLNAKGYEFVPLAHVARGRDVNNLAHSHWLGASQAEDAQETAKALSDMDWDWLIVDHYALDAHWESALRPVVKRIFVIDDIADRQHDSDILLDQNFYSDMNLRYTGKVPPHCQLLLGPRYALLREEFREVREQIKPRIDQVGRVLIFFGGVDAENYTGKAVSAISGLHCALNVDVVIGAQHPARAEIEAACALYGYVCHVQTSNMSELMANADLAIGGGGVTTWERCCLGLPALVLCLADNQQKLIDDSARAGLLYAPVMECDVTSGLFHHLKALLENPGLRALISRNGMDAVDGSGTFRVLRKMGCNSVQIRLASERDSENILTWRNHPAIRSVSREKQPIAAGDHELWMQNVLRDEGRDLLIGYWDEHQPVGVVRFDMVGDCAEVSIYVVPGLNGQGLGVELLESAEQWLYCNRPGVKHILANVLGDNASSHRLFNACGYTKDYTCYSKRVH